MAQTNLRVIEYLCPTKNETDYYYDQLRYELIRTQEEYQLSNKSLIKLVRLIVD